MVPQVEEHAAPSPLSQLPDGAYAVVQHSKLRFRDLVQCSVSERVIGGFWVSLDRANRTMVQQPADQIPTVRGTFICPPHVEASRAAFLAVDNRWFVCCNPSALRC